MCYRVIIGARTLDHKFVTQHRSPKASFRDFLFFWVRYVRDVEGLQGEAFPVNIDRDALISSSNRKSPDYSNSRPTGGA